MKACRIKIVKSLNRLEFLREIFFLLSKQTWKMVKIKLQECSLSLKITIKVLFILHVRHYVMLASDHIQQIKSSLVRYSCAPVNNEKLYSVFSLK